MTTRQTKLVICGTDTDVGKTIISALIVHGLQATYWKPIQSGMNDGGDRQTVCELLNLPPERWIPEAYCFKAPVSPHWAAELEDRYINKKRLNIPQLTGPLVIETAGGLMVPLTREWMQIDQLQVWDLPIILVARSGLGTLNHSLLSIEALRLRKIKILGLILNGPIHSDNSKTLEEISNVPIIAEIPTFNQLNIDALNEQWIQQNLKAKFKKILNQ